VYCFSPYTHLFIFYLCTICVPLLPEQNHFQLINIISSAQTTTQCTHKCNNEVHLHDHSCLGRTISIIYSEYASAALRYQHAMCMCCIILSSVSGLVKPYFSKLSPKRHNLWRQGYWIQHMFRFSVLPVSKSFHILRRTERDININAHWSSHKVPVLLVSF